MTNKEIAKKLHISETTLSFIINNKPGIAEKTRARVIEEINALGYGHILKKESPALTGSICFIIYKRHGDILNQTPFYLLLLEQIEERARNSGFNLIVRVLDKADQDKADQMDVQIHELNAADISGIIVFATEMLDDDVEFFKRIIVPVVFLDNDFTLLEMDSVVINNRAGTFKAVEHLVANGHREIGYLQSKTYINSFGERDEGYRKALTHFGIDLSSKHHFRLGYTEEESYQEFRRILAGGISLPTAFVSDEDTITAGVLRALIEDGIAVPDRVSLVGFNDRPICRFTNPTLTTVSVPKEGFGALAVDLLVERMERPRESVFDYRKVEVGIQLVVRESTRMI